MPTPFGHAIVAYAIKPFFLSSDQTFKLLFLGFICTIIPDIDVKTFDYGIPYSHPFGHRGFTHSIFFSLVFGFLISFIFYFSLLKKSAGLFLKISLYFFFCTLSHALFDMMTSGGLGCAIFAPFDNTRYFLPFRPIKVAPFKIKALMGERGLRILVSEFVVCWIPCLLLILFSRGLKSDQ